MHRFLLPLLLVTAPVYAAEASPVVDAYQRMLQALEQKTEALESIKQAEDAQKAVEPVREALQKLQALFAVDEKELFNYIDNTAGIKQPLIDIMQRMALQFSRLEQNAYYNNAQLRELLAPQIEAGSSQKKIKHGKLREEDSDDD